VLTATGLVLLGELLLPTSGAAGFLPRMALWLLYPALLLLSGFFTDEERGWLSRLRHPGKLAVDLRSAATRPAAVDGVIPESFEAELLDEDSRL